MKRIISTVLFITIIVISWISRVDITTAAGTWSPAINLTKSDKLINPPSIAVGINGEIYVVWDQNVTAFGVEDIYFTEYQNGSWSTPVIIANGYISNQALAVDKTGKVHLVYRKDGAWPHTGYYKTYDGNTWSAASIVYSGVYAEDHWSHPKLALNSQNNPHVVWANSGRDVGAIPSVYYTYWNGDSWTTPIAIASNAYSPDIAVSNTDKVDIAWYDQGTKNVKYRYRDGLSWSAPIPLTNDLSGAPAIVSDRVGNVHIVWASAGDIFYTTSDRLTWPTPINVTNSLASNNPDLMIDQDQNVHIVWQKNVAGSYDIFHKYFNGISWTAEENISQTAMNSIVPSIAVDQNRGLHVIWSDATPGNYYQAYYSTKTTALYTINGYVKDVDKKGLAGVIITEGSSGQTITNSNGQYTLNVPKQGVYDLKPNLANYDFSPRVQHVGIYSTNKTVKEFVGTIWGGMPTGFLDLPFTYDGTIPTFQKILQNWKDDGLINSWFDHEYPDRSTNSALLIYNTSSFTNWYKSTCYDYYCYDGHNGIDFKKSDATDIIAAADGEVVRVTTTCADDGTDPGCNSGWGNYVVLYHKEVVDIGNGYFTLYAHLQTGETEDVSQDKNVAQHQKIGVMGNSGNSTGTHLHFGVYRDNGNETWEPGIDKAVDPFGWSQNQADPWVEDDARRGAPSYPLWIHDLTTQISFAGADGATIADKADIFHASVPANTFSGQVTLDLAPGPVPSALAPFRSTSQSYWLTIDQYWIDNDSQAPLKSQALIQPISISYQYDSSALKHLNEQQLSLFRWDDPTGNWIQLISTVDIPNQTVFAETDEVGAFNIQAPLICIEESAEPFNDQLDGAVEITPGNNISAVFDISDDQDWYTIQPESGKSYFFSLEFNATIDITAKLELYDLDGSTLLASKTISDPSETLKWTSTGSEVYYLKVVPENGSYAGCDAEYELWTTEEMQIFIPNIRR